MANLAPIVIKKKVVHGGHHGGAWKVAYADFVTAMMALFIVLWLLNSSKEVKEAVGGYFKDPTGTSKLVGNGQHGSGENFNVSKDNMEELKEELQKSVRKMNDFDKLKNQIEMTVTSEGLRVELLESDVGTFFTSGSAAPSDKGREMLIMLAREMGKLPNKVSMEGHTDSKPFSREGTYSNWELSTDRANSARRVMQQSGMRVDQVSQVRGYADQRLRKPKAPEDASNRRISMIVQYLANDGPSEAEPKEPKEGERETKEGEKKAGKEPEPGKHAAEKPAEKHGAEKPAEKHVAEKPAEKHVAEKPAEKPAAEKPADKKRPAH
jgi:chemotaxis protein MotB